MIETEIIILINRKTDIDIIKKNIVDSKIQFPVYIFEYENHYQIRFESDYEEWELDTKILNCFPEWEFTTGIENGRKEIRLQISRNQTGLSTDGWGRPIEDPLNETKYLIKRTTTKPEEINPQIKVLFAEKVQNYYVNIVGGINKATEEKGFLLLNDFKSKNKNNEAEILKDHLYKSPIEAFQFSYYKMQDLVNRDFAEYIKLKKKEMRELHKIPRKIIRDFINSCNKSNVEEIFKNLDENVTFEKIINLQIEERIEGLKNFKEYIVSPNQKLCARDFTIRSSWNINLPIITIDVKYYPTSTDSGNNSLQRYKQITFELKNDKIFRVIYGR